ncbi:MAG: S41 family peptidase [Sediminibacterium sp.]
MAPAPLRDDLVLLKKILEANHPSLYWYLPKDSLDAYFNYTINSLTDSTDEVTFRNKAAWLLGKIRCGHTTVRFSKAYRKIAGRYRFPQFPLALKTWDDSLVVLGSAFAGDTIFKRGTIITSINGRTNRQLLDTFFQFISTDGYSDNYKNQLVSINFPAWYKTILGTDSNYTITYIGTNGKETTTVIKNFSPPRDTTGEIKTAALLPSERPTRKQLREARRLDKRVMTIDPANSTAFIRLSTFTGGRLHHFFCRSFKIIRRQHLQNLVIDLRENGGGNVANSILLSKYLAAQPFKVGDSVVAISRKFRYGRYIHPAWAFWIAMNFAAHKEKDGLIHYRRFETHYFKPKVKNHFNGNVYLVQGGFTFSAASMFISGLKGQSNVKVVGEETGGGYYGNSAMHIPAIILPLSGLEVSLPMYRLVMDARRSKGRGVLPDIEIKPSSGAIKAGIDLKMQTIKAAIQRKSF